MGKDRDDIVDQLGALIKKRDNKIKELEERLKHPQSASKMTAIKKKVHLNDAVEEDFLTASSDSDTNESAPGRKRRSAEVAETSVAAGKTPDAKAAFARPATEPKRRKTANSAAKAGIRSSSRVTRGASQSVEDHEETSNDASSPPLKPPRTRANEDSDDDDESKENEKSSKKASARSTRQSSRKPTSSAKKTRSHDAENENESEPSDETEEDGEKKDKGKSRRKLYSQPMEPINLAPAIDAETEKETWGVSPMLKRLERQERERNPRAGRVTRTTRNK